jgi:CxxC motif-containing protein
MKRELTCVACPLGCSITVEYDDSGVQSVTGNTCKRGDAYARTEIVNPTRSLATTVKVNGGIHPVVPVKSNAPVPKKMMFECMKAINAASVDAPVQIGQVIIRDILGTGADIVATNND